MSNPSAGSIVPCCGETGDCLNCCNDTNGVIYDLSAAEGGPAVGTYDLLDGGTLQITRLSMVTDEQFIRFGPTTIPGAATLTERGPHGACCTQCVGIAQYIRRNSGATITETTTVCVTAAATNGGAGNSTFTVKVGNFVWFGRTLGTSAKMAQICQKPRDWVEMSNDQTHDLTYSLQHASTLRLKASNANDIGYTATSSTLCLCRCNDVFDITVTVSGLAGMEFESNEFGTYTIDTDEFSVTFEGRLFCDGGTLVLDYTDSGQVELALSNASTPDACLTVGLSLILDKETGRILLRSDLDEGDTYVNTLSYDCDGDATGDTISFLAMNFDIVTCGDAQLDGTGTIELWDEQADVSMGFADVTITQN
jgi:hypothetical protein